MPISKYFIVTHVLYQTSHSLLRMSKSTQVLSEAFQAHAKISQ